MYYLLCILVSSPQYVLLTYPFHHPTDSKEHLQAGKESGGWADVKGPSPEEDWSQMFRVGSEEVNR